MNFISRSNITEALQRPKEKTKLSKPLILGSGKQPFVTTFTAL